MSTSVARALHCWAEGTKAFTAKVQQLQKSAMASDHRNLALACSAWAEFVSARTRLVVLVRIRLRTRNARCLAETMRRWSVGSLLVKKTDKMRRRAWLHLQGAQLSRGWQLWLASSVAQAKLLPFQRYVAAKLRLRYLAMWRKAATSAHARYGAWSKAAIVMQRLMHRALSRGWSSWTERGYALKRLVNLVHDGIEARHAHYLAETMRRWSVGSLLVKKTDKMRRRAWLHLQGAQLSRGWQLWLASSVAQAKLLPFQRYVAAKLRLHAFCSWRQMYYDHRRNRELQRRASMMILPITQAWRAWAKCAHRRAERLAMQCRVVTTWMSRHVASSWRRWVEMARERSRQMQLLRKGVVWLLSLEFARCMATWREAATIEHARVDALSKAAIVVRRLVHLSLSRGWSSWVSGWCEEVRTCELVRQVLQSLMRQSLARAWRTWYYGALNLLCVSPPLTTLRRGVGRLMSLEVVHAWTAWLALSWRHRTLQRLSMVAFTNAALARAWRRWVEMAVQCRVVATWMSRHVASSWRRWVEMASERSRQLQLLRKSAAGLLLRDCALCMRSWREAASLAQERFDALSKAAIVVRRLVHLSLSRGWSSWVSGWCEEVRTCEVVRQVLRLFMRQSLARAWRTWSELALSREDQLRALRPGGITLMARRWWRAWVNVACERSRQQQLLRKGIAFLMSRGLAAWFDATAVAHSHGEALAAAAEHVSRRRRTIHRLLCRGWESWLDSWRDTVRTRELRRKVLEYAPLKALGALHPEEVSSPFRFQRRPATTTRPLQNRAVET